MSREWRDIADAEGRYQVSNDGYVRSLPDIDRRGRILQGVVLSTPLNHKGYPVVRFFGKTHRVHRLVALAFVPEVPDKPQINHRDGNKQNNRADNLEWVTNGENQTHRYQVLNHPGPMSGRTGANCPNSKPVVGVNMLTKEVRRFPAASEAARQLGIHASAISGSALKKTRSAGGWHWSYE